MVIGDYEYIMPVPFRKKFGIKYTYRPNFCQQLGVFTATHSLSELTVESFIQELCNKYSQIHYPLNYSNNIKKQTALTIKERTNFVLSLNSPYEFIFSKYSDSLRKTLKVSEKVNLEINSDIKISDIINLHKTAWHKLVKISDTDYTNFQKIVEFTNSYYVSEGLGIFKDGRLLGACLILKYKSRIYYPFSAITLEGRKYSAIAVLINYIIKRNAGTNFIFDFEGSDIPGVKTLYQKFKPYNEPYLQIEKTIPYLNKIISFLKGT